MSSLMHNHAFLILLPCIMIMIKNVITQQASTIAVVNSQYNW